MPTMDHARARGITGALLAGLALAALTGPPVAAGGVIATTTQPPIGLRSALASLLPELDGDATSATSDGSTSSSPASPQAKTAAPALPACRYRDQLTRYHEVRHWRKTLLDTNLRVTRSYEPWDLVSVSRAGIRGSGMVRQRVIADLAAMASAAKRRGKALAARSAYRSYQTQVATFNSWVERSGYEAALRFSARPGHSEHQLGTTIDFTTAPGVPLSSSFGNSPAGRWLARNSWRFGFVMSYPKGKQRTSCYGYEPWHFRYVGRELARRIHASGDVPRRFLWETFESAP